MDLLVQRADAKARHTIVAIGSSSIDKGNKFVQSQWENTSQPRPKVYDHYQGVYDDSNVDVVYIGTPHLLHMRNCLDAIATKGMYCARSRSP